MGLRNIIHPTAVVSPDIELGDNNRIGPYSVIGGMGCKVSIGSNNYFGAYCLVGSPAEYATGCPIDAMLDFDRWALNNPTEVAGVLIGDFNVFRDRVSIDAGIRKDTTIKNRCYLHSLSQINHDCQLEEGVVFAPGVISAGTCSFGKFSQIGVNAVLHQGRTVGAFSMVGMNATVTRDIPNFALSYGSPAKLQGVNRVRLERLGISKDDIEEVDHFLKGTTHVCPDSVLGLLK